MLHCVAFSCAVLYYTVLYNIPCFLSTSIFNFTINPYPSLYCSVLCYPISIRYPILHYVSCIIFSHTILNNIVSIHIVSYIVLYYIITYNTAHYPIYRIVCYTSHYVPLRHVTLYYIAPCYNYTVYAVVSHYIASTNVALFYYCAMACCHVSCCPIL